jgi:hypothetical protein
MSLHEIRSQLKLTTYKIKQEYQNEEKATHLFSGEANLSLQTVE